MLTRRHRTKLATFAAAVVAVAGLATTTGCTKSKPAEDTRPPEVIAREILDKEKAGALACKRMGESAGKAFDQGIAGQGDDQSRKIGAARTQKLGATVCLTTWTQQVMQKLARAKVPGNLARQEVQAFLTEHVGGATAPVF